MSAAEPGYDDTVVIDDGPADPAARNPLLVVGAVVGGVALAALVWFFLITPLLLGDDAGASDPAAAPSDPTVTDPDATPSPDAPETVDPDVDEVEDVEELPITTFEVFLSRDPFEPVVPEPVAATDNSTVAGPGDADQPGDEGTDPGTTEPGTDPTSPGTPTDPGSPTDPVTPPPTGGGNGTTPSPAPTSPRCTADDPPVCDGRVVSLIEITQDSQGFLAVVQVDTTIYEVREGDVFAGSFRALRITADTFEFSFGDDANQRLRPGERTLK